MGEAENAGDVGQPRSFKTFSLLQEPLRISTKLPTLISCVHTAVRPNRVGLSVCILHTG